MRLKLVIAAALVGALAFVASSRRPHETVAEDAGGFEVWGLDQSDTHPNGGGVLYVWDGAALATNPGTAPAQTVDLAVAATNATVPGGCPVGKRPHMGLANDANGLGGPATHFVLANFESGDIQIINIASRTMVGCVRLSGLSGGLGVGSTATHASVTTPNKTMILVDDILGGKFHKIQADFDTNTYTYRETLALGGPSDAEIDSRVEELLGTNRARPVCHGYTADSKYAFVTMQQGGLVVVDLGGADGTPPMRVKHVYPAALVPGIGCGAMLLPDGRMMANGEAGQFGGNDFLYFFDISGIGSNSFPNPVQVSLPGEDTHGAFPCVDRNGKVYVWTTMRVSNQINIVDTTTNQVILTKSVERPFLVDPKPDGLEIRNGRAYVTVRGPKPLSGVAHPTLQNPDRRPGVLVLNVAADCTDFGFRNPDLADMDAAIPSATVPRTTVVNGKTVTVSDPHGLDVLPR